MTAVTELAETGTMLTGNELLQVEGLEKHFPVTRGIIFQKQIASVKAVDGVTFGVKEGETLGVVGESGCGKSTMARCALKYSTAGMKRDVRNVLGQSFGD